PPFHRINESLANEALPGTLRWMGGVVATEDVRSGRACRSHEGRMHAWIANADWGASFAGRCIYFACRLHLFPLIPHCSRIDLFPGICHYLLIIVCYAYS